MYFVQTIKLHLPLSDTVHLHRVEIGQVVVLVLDAVLTQGERGKTSRRIAPCKNSVRTSCNENNASDSVMSHRETLLKVNYRPKQ